jgi:hypothetical protein
MEHGVLTPRLNRMRAWLLMLAVSVSFGALQTAQATNESILTSHVNALADTLSAPEQQTLSRIPQLERRLLALRAYVRTGPKVESRWSWTDAEIRAYQRSDAYQMLLQDLAKVSAAFEQQNPGYTLFANTEVRSLDTQIDRWNSNVRVGKTADNLLAAASKAIGRAPLPPSAASLADFKAFLASWRPSPVAPLAAPGLSMHGRMQAVDFQIMRNGRIVAATELGAVASQWEAPGWHHKLKQAVVASGTDFEGPLKSPNEPWHYEYTGPAWVASNRK